MFKFHVPFQEQFFRSTVLMLFGLVLALGVAFDSNSPAQAQTASQLNQRGFELLYSGAAAEAFSTWQAATEQYQAEESLDGVKGSQLNQTLAMQALGLYPRACLKLTNVLALSAWPCAQDLQRVSKPEELTQALSNLPANEINSIGLRLLGENLRLLGKLPESEEVLRHAQSFQIEDPLEQARLGLALGATHQLSLQAALESFGRTDYSDIQLQQRFADKVNLEAEHATHQYQSLVSLRELDAGLALQARLNLIDMFIDYSDRIEQLPSWALTDLSSWQVLKPTAMSAIAVVLEETADFESLPAIEAIYGRLNLAKNLLALENLSNLAGESWDEGQLASQRWELAEAAVAIAQKIDDKRALSTALGVSAALMEEEQFPASDIQATYLRALALAQAVQATDIAYQWEYRLAKLYEAEGQLEKATQGYRAAIESLFQVRENLISVNSELRFSFRKNIEPVYRDYIGLLAEQPTQVTLSKTVDVHEALQLAELENYLGCGRLGTAELDRSNVGVEVTSVNVINLGEVIKVVVRSPEGRYFGYGVSSSEVLPPANNLLANLQSSSFIGVQEADILPYAQALYQALLAPAREAGIIPAAGELSFILDAPFQGIPMAMLHDGQQYLIESYGISNALRSQQSAAQKLESDRALVAGLSETSPSFGDPLVPSQLQPLPDTEFEIQGIEKYLSASVLLNEAFTASRLEREAAKGYEVVHISTHGQFSSDPDQTFLMAWDELIDMDQMYRIFQDDRSEMGIDLLVLSACQTATGDERSVLGMAGIAVQAGARSTVASLWLVDSASSAVLMEEFYRGLNGGLSKSEALRQAQLVLLNSSAFSHPFYWAPFIFAEGES